MIRQWNAGTHRTAILSKGNIVMKDQMSMHIKICVLFVYIQKGENYAGMERFILGKELAK